MDLLDSTMLCPKMNSYICKGLSGKFEVCEYENGIDELIATFMVKSKQSNLGANNSMLENSYSILDQESEREGVQTFGLERKVISN